MAKPHLKNSNGHFVESDQENALIIFSFSTSPQASSSH